MSALHVFDRPLEALATELDDRCLEALGALFRLAREEAPPALTAQRRKRILAGATQAVSEWPDGEGGAA